MDLFVTHDEVEHRVAARGPDAPDDVVMVNRFLAHLSVRNFAAATQRAYAYDLLNFLRFLSTARLVLAEVKPMDLFDYLDWQSRPRPASTSVVVVLAQHRGAAPATLNRRIAVVRGLFEFMVIAGLRAESPVPAGRRSTGLRATRRGVLGHLGPARTPGAGRLVRAERRLPESLEPAEVAMFIASLISARDRAMALVMLLGGLRAGEVRSLRLRDVDVGLRRLRVVGKGDKERVVPVDKAFFTELASYLRHERPAGCSSPECFVVLRGPTAGGALTEAGMRRIFRSHRDRAGTPRVRPHRLRHTYGTELAAAGIDLLVLRELMGHASPETTAAYVHLSAVTLASEYADARRRLQNMTTGALLSSSSSPRSSC